MKRPRHIERDAYHALDWAEGSGLTIPGLCECFPELVLGHYLVNTSFDSGFLPLSDSERQNGWSMVGQLAHSPLIRDIAQIPDDLYCEWLVFERPVQVGEFESMVDYCSFTPVDFDWDEKRERFWNQVTGLQPLHVIGENSRVYLVSRDESLVRKIMNAEPGTR
jgi:hypothetical protein